MTPGLRRGIDLFNSGRYWDAHEVWEHDWMPDRKGPESGFYKGLIQVAVAQLQLQRANLVGAAKMFARAERCLRPYAPKYMGLDVAAVLRAVEQRQLKAENKQLKQEIRRRERSGLVKPLGKSRPFLDVLRLAEQVAPTESTVLIQGESGTGKEVIARYVHELSGRNEAPFLSLNCGALPESLLESELFGHVKGSFTGAVRDKQGLFAAARGGTFFLDEIGEMSPATQVKVLRVLQEREAIPVGGTEAIPLDVRVVAATNRDLEDDIKRGRFRTDLYYRLNVIAIHLPPLRERRDDIPIFVDAFLARIAVEHQGQPKRLGQDALDAIMVYDWPGNVRELENALERASVLTKGETIPLAAMPEKITERRAEPLVADRSHMNPTLDVIEQAYITWVLQSEGGNKTRAAEVLGIDPSTLYRKLSRYEGGDKEKAETGE